MLTSTAKAPMLRLASALRVTSAARNESCNSLRSNNPLVSWPGGQILREEIIMDPMEFMGFLEPRTWCLTWKKKWHAGKETKVCQKVLEIVFMTCILHLCPASCTLPSPLANSGFHPAGSFILGDFKWIGFAASQRKETVGWIVCYILSGNFIIIWMMYTWFQEFMYIHVT